VGQDFAPALAVMCGSLVVANEKARDLGNDRGYRLAIRKGGDGMSFESGGAGRGSAGAAIAIGGVLAGTLDIFQACIKFGWDIPKVIAAGLLGPAVINDGGAGIYVLGLILHYFIACSAAAIFYAASRRLRFMTQSWIVCGLFFGMAVQLVMGYIVLPLSALHVRGPFKLDDILIGFGTHMVVIGLPIAWSARKFGSDWLK
jgi:hypothetical protein